MSTTTRLLLAAFTGIALLGCAAQSPEDQVSRKQTVRLCTGTACVDQDRQVVRFAGASVDSDAERRLAALTERAGRNPKAAYDLGLRLLRGDGVERNGYQALEWMRRAGDQGLVEAQSALGRLYLVGFEEMGSDPAEAHAWLTRAAAGGDQASRRLLPEAEEARKNLQARYEAREDARTSLASWYSAAPYYWHWNDGGWHLR